LTAKGISKATGDLTLGGDTNIDIDGTVDVQGGNLNLEDNATVADDEMLKASGNVTVAAGKTLTAEGDLTLEATGGAITEKAGDDNKVQIHMDVDDKTLMLTQNDAINMSAFEVTNNIGEDTDLVANSTGGSVTSTTADDWRSITAEAKDNIELSGSGDIKIGGDLTSSYGGVSIISDAGGIYDAGSYDYGTMTGTALDNVTITGSSDEEGGVGVDLPFADWGTGTKAAIVIQSKSQDLKLGPDATLIANGTYNPLDVDDRGSVAFVNGDPIDVAIYLGSFSAVVKVEPDWWLMLNGANLDMGSESVSIDNTSGIGTLVIDAYDTVTFTDDFETSLQAIRPDNVRRLEVVSRISEDLVWAIGGYGPGGVERPDHGFNLPYADNPSGIAGGFFNGTYILRGEQVLEWWFNYTKSAKVLDWSDPVPLVPPKPEEPEEPGAVEEPDMEALRALLMELGIGVQPYLAKAYPPSLNTDMRLFKAAEKLQNLIPMLEDAEGTRIAALRVVVGQFFSTLASISDEQMASFRQELAQHVGDGTDYDLAGESISALVKYVEILGTDIGWPMDRSVGFVMGRYIPRLTEGDAIRTAVVQIQLQEALGI